MSDTRRLLPIVLVRTPEGPMPRAGQVDHRHESEPMGSPGKRLRLATTQRWLAHLLLISFAVRALIPAGYMTEARSASTGSFKLVICTAGGPTTARDTAFDGRTTAPGLPVDGTQDHAQPCAFAGLFVYACPELSRPILNQPDQAQGLNIRPDPEIAPPARAGPAHGSRAPPLFV
jgi:hypothetical protein